MVFYIKFLLFFIEKDVCLIDICLGRVCILLDNILLNSMIGFRC